MNQHVAGAFPANGLDPFARRSEGLRQQLPSSLQLVDQGAKRPEPRTMASTISEQHVRAVLKWRRKRDSFFGQDLFADPAWDILLELLATELGQRRISVSSLCAGAAVPATTALRWIKNLEERALVRRTPDPTDARRTFISLSSEALKAMTKYLESRPAEAVLA